MFAIAPFVLFRLVVVLYYVFAGVVVGPGSVAGCGFVLFRLVAVLYYVFAGVFIGPGAIADCGLCIR